MRRPVVLSVVSALVLLLGLAPAVLAAQSPEDIYQRPLRYEPNREADVLHYRIELRFEEATRSYWGRTTLTARSMRERLEMLSLDAETFVVTAVRDATGSELSFEHDDGELNVHLAEDAAFGDSIEFTVEYEARDVDVDAERFGLAADYDLGLDFKNETRDNPRLINTLSWPEGARHWFPSNDHPHDRATQEVIATVRDDYQVISNGRLVGVSTGAEPGTRTWHWSQELAHPTYLFVLVAGPYVAVEDSYGELPLRYWVYEKDRADALRSFGKTPRMMAFFEKEYGYEYPWNKYDQITIPGIGGGAESTGATVVGHSTIHDGRAEQDFPSHGLVAHELAHQWWGNLVSYRDWSEAWLSESFATYGEHLFTKHDLGEDEGAVNLLQKKNAYLRESRERYQRPIRFRRWRHPNDNFDRHTYQKGAVVLSMLRFVMGNEAFRRAISHFLQSNAFSPVDTHDFKNAIKDSSGQNLDWFIEQWIERPGHPVLDVSYEWTEGEPLRLRVRQLQDRANDTPVYRAPVDVRLETASSRTTHRIWISTEDEVFELETEAEPLLVRFDEGNHLLKEWRFEKSVSELLYQLRSDDVIGRMWAAAELAKHLDDDAVSAELTRVATDDGFWAVRRAAVEALESSEDGSFSRLLERTSLDSDSRVREASLRVLSGSDEPRLAWFCSTRFREDESYVVQAAALRCLGHSGDASVTPLLEEAAGMVSPRDVVGRAAREALAMLGR
jgi:aminopeptidase N